MEIIVSGEHYVELAPEYATANFSASAQGGSQAVVAAQASGLGNRLADALRAVASNVVVDPLRISAWTDGTKKRASASVDLRGDFSSAEKLAEFQAVWSVEDGVQAGWVAWNLTAATMKEREAEVLAGALSNASVRARHIADAAGAGALVILQIADPGLMSEPVTTYDASPKMMRASMAGAPPVDVSPQKLRISARLDVRFRAE